MSQFTQDVGKAYKRVAKGVKATWLDTVNAGKMALQGAKISQPKKATAKTTSPSAYSKMIAMQNYNALSGLPVSKTAGYSQAQPAYSTLKTPSGAPANQTWSVPANPTGGGATPPGTTQPILDTGVVGLDGGSVGGSGAGGDGGGGIGVPVVDPMESVRALAKQNADSMYAGAEAGHAKTRDQALADVTKAYDDAIATGKMNEEEANSAYNTAVSQINEQAYRDSQLTNAMAYSRGIGNSQQMLGLMAGDNQRTNNMRTDVLTERDKRIQTLKDRIAGLTKEKDLDTAQINQNFNYDITQARSEADRYYNDFLIDQATSQASYGGGGSGGGGGSRNASVDTGKYNVNDAGTLIDQYKDFVASKQQTALDQYYARAENATKRSVMDKRMPLGAPRSVASNPNLTAYQKYKMFQNDFGGMANVAKSKK